MPKFISDDEMAQLDGAKPSKKTISDAEMAAIEAEVKNEAKAPLASRVLLQTLNAPSSAMLAAGAKGAAQLTGQGDKVTSKDIIAGLKGQGPQFSDYLSRLGGPELEGVKKHLANLAVGGAVDPLTYATMGVGGLAKEGLGKAALRPIATGAEKAAYPVYKTGLSRVDAALVQKAGIEPFESGARALPSQVLFEENIWGKVPTLRKKGDELGEKLLSERGNIYKEMPPIDSATIDYSKAQEIANRFLAHPKTKKKAEGALEELSEYVKRGQLTPEQLSSSKSTLQELAARAGQYGADPQSGTVASAVDSAAAQAEKLALERAAETVASGKGGRLKEINKKLGALISEEKPMSNLEAIEMRKMRLMPTVVDVALPTTVGLATGNPKAAIAAYIAKKGADVLRTPSVQTGLGIGLKKAGESTIWDVMARRAFLDTINEGE